MTIRKYQSGDLPKIIKLFCETVQNVNSNDYSSEQIAAWISGVDIKKWNCSLLAHTALVACENDTIIGFGDIDQSGYLDRLYVHKDYQRMGVASDLLCELENSCNADKFTTFASITAKPFFLAKGYKTIRENYVIRDGVSLVNFLMEKL